MPNFNEVLKNLRKSAGLTQRELSMKTGISRSRINNYERGIREPDFETAELFADFFNVDLDTLFDHVPSSSDGLTSSERALLSFFRDLNDKGQDHVLSFVEAMSRSGIYKVGM